MAAVRTPEILSTLILFGLPLAAVSRASNNDRDRWPLISLLPFHQLLTFTDGPLYLQISLPILYCYLLR